MRARMTCVLVVLGVLSAGAASAAGAPQAGEGGAMPAGMVRQIKVLADKAPDCSSRKAIVASVTRGCKTNDEKAIAIYNFLRLVNYHHAYPNEPGGVAALKLINVYGWSLCGGQHAALSALWRAAGWEHRFVGWSGHTTVEVQYDGQWHYFDTFLKIYVWKQDPNAPGGRTVASQADIAENPELITRDLVLDAGRKVYYHRGNQFEIINEKANWTAPAFLVCGDGPDGVISGTKGRHRSGSPAGWATVKHDEGGYNTDVNLAPGMSLELMWRAIDDAWYWQGMKRPPFHSCGDKDYRNCPALGPVLEPYRNPYPPVADANDPRNRGARTYSSGKLVFAPDLGNEAFLSGLAAKENVKVAGGQLAPADASGPASITVPLQSPYVMARASGQADGAASAEVSVDGGKTFKPVELKDFSQAVRGKYACQVKLTFKQPMKSLRLEIIVQHNRCALPYLSPGPNKISVSVDDAKALGGNRLAVTYAYNLGARRISYEELAEMGAEVGRAHKAEWPDTPTVVQKLFTAKDLPATFDIPVPTPKDKYPVYPQMLLVLAPGSKPLPLPEGAVEPKIGPGDELKTLPNPFLMGIAKPPKKTPRPTATRKIALRCSHVVSRKSDGTAGPVYENFYIKTRPKDPEAWVMLVGGQLSDLPAPRDMAAAHLCIPVTNSNPNATTQVAAVLLKVPFESMKPYDFNNFGAVLGTVNIPKQAEPGPAKYYKIEITRGLKQIAAGEVKFHGLAIRTVPNRSVDEGWTTRIDITKKEPTYIELEVYTDKKAG